MPQMIATREAYGKALAQLGSQNEKIVVLDADLAHATMTKYFAEVFPDRFFNAGIAEANMTDMAVGLAEMGYIPVISTFAVFGTGRNFEQIRNSICYSRANVKLAMTHAGISVGPDGGSHQAIEDVALMRVLPGMTVLCPADAKETEKALEAAISLNGPVYIRLSRMASPVLDEHPFTIGKANCLREGTDGVIFAYGLMVSQALAAAEKLAESGLEISVYNFHTIKPLDVQTVRFCAEHFQKIITLEEHSVIGGLGDAVAAVLSELGIGKLQKMGMPDVFGQSGKPEELLQYYHLNADSIAQKSLEFFG